jgi:hypothetical protein
MRNMAFKGDPNPVLARLEAEVVSLAVSSATRT